jgi:hypothetical protein
VPHWSQNRRIAEVGSLLSSKRQRIITFYMKRPVQFETFTTWISWQTRRSVLGLDVITLTIFPTMSSQTYSSLRSDLRHQESKTEIALAELSSLTNSAPSQQDTEIEDRLLETFAQRRETIDTMSRVVENDPSGGGARVHQIARAREILVEHEKEFRRMKVSSLKFEGELIGSRQFSRREIERR